MDFLFGIILAFASMILWGFSDLVTKASLDKTSKWKVLFFGQFFGGLLVLIIVLFFADLKILASSGISYLFLLGLINVAGIYAYYKSMKKKGVALTSPIANSWVFVTVILGLIFYNEVVSGLQWLAIILIVGGVFAITFRKTQKISFDSSFLFAILSMIIWGVFFFLLKVPNIIFGAIIVTASIKLLTSFFSVPILIKKKIKMFQTEHKIWFYMILIGILDSVGFLAFNFALHYSPVSIVSAIGSAVPVVSVLLGVIILKEELTKKQRLGIITAIIGLIIISI